MSNEKKGPWLFRVYVGDEHLRGLFHKPFIRIGYLNNQDSMESESFFCGTVGVGEWANWLL